MDEQVVHEIVDEILSSLEPLDTQSAALLQFLKDKGIAREEEFAPYLEQAGKASNVRWLAARVRIKSLISSAMKSETKIETRKAAEATAEAESPKSAGESREPSAQTEQEAGAGKHSDEASGNAEKNGEDSQSEDSVPVAGGKEEIKKEGRRSKTGGDAKQAA